MLAKYQIVSSKEVVRVDWPVYALFKHKHNPCLKASREKWLSSQSCHFVNNDCFAPNFFMQMFNVSIFENHMLDRHSCHICYPFEISGWLGRAMVLGSFQCWDILLLWHMVEQGPAVLAADAGRVGCFLLLFFHPVYPIFLF